MSGSWNESCGRVLRADSFSFPPYYDYGTDILNSHGGYYGSDHGCWSKVYGSRYALYGLHEIQAWRNGFVWNELNTWK